MDPGEGFQIVVPVLIESMTREHRIEGEPESSAESGSKPDIVELPVMRDSRLLPSISEREDGLHDKSDSLSSSPRRPSMILPLFRVLAAGIIPRAHQRDNPRPRRKPYDDSIDPTLPVVLEELGGFQIERELRRFLEFSDEVSEVSSPNEIPLKSRTIPNLPPNSST